MPDTEPGVDPADAAPSEEPGAQDTDRPTPPSTPPSAADSPAAEEFARVEDEAADEVAAIGDEWDATPESPAAEAGPRPAQGDQFPTGVLEIVHSLDAEPEGAVEAPVESTAHAESAEEPGPSVAEPADVASSEAGAAEGATDTESAPIAGEAAGETFAEAAPEVAAEGVPAAKVPWWPFAAYLGLWVVGLGVAAYELLKVPPGRALYEEVLYGYLVQGGLVLTALGVVLIPFEWILARWGVEKERRRGLFARTAFWGALSTLLGVLLWWAMLIALDSVRLGRAL